MKRAICCGVLAVISTAAFGQSSPGNQFMQTWDLDQNGVVTVAELRKMRGNVFNAFDKDQNGYLSAEEYVAFDAARASDVENYDDEQREQMKSVASDMSLKNSDADGDGRVGRQEFLAGADDWFDDLDKNNDDKVTLKDFDR